jgi:DNA-packaging protein gp3
MSNVTIQGGKDPNTGRFTTGNRWWEARSSHGPNPKFETADDLQDACLQYFDWNEANPLFKDVLVTFQGQATHEPVAQMRAMTLGALCMFIDISQQTWSDWRKDRADLSGVITWAESVIYRQKFEGASADLLNANIIARDLGLADKKDLSSTDGTMTPKPSLDLSKLSTEALAELVAARDAASKD